MSELPTILVTNGWKTDRNRKLTEVVIPSTVKTLQAPNKVTFMGTTLTAVPSTVAALQEFVAPNMTTWSNTGNSLFHNYTSLVAVSMESMVSMTTQGSEGQFRGCSALKSVYFPNLTNMSCSGANGAGGVFRSCTALSVVNFPKLYSTTTTNDGGIFTGCTGLMKVTLGSEGNAVQALGSYTFKGCTQSGLTITIYTTGGASLSGSPWGATNATIVYETA